MELAMMIGSSAAGAAGAGAASSILWAPAGMTVAQAAAAGIPLAASSAAGAGGILSSLSTGLTMASMATSLFGGLSAGAGQERAAELEAKGLELDAKQQELQGKQNANDILDNMIQTIATQRLAFSGAGIDPSVGTAATVGENARKLAEMQLGTSRANTRNAVLARRRGAASTRMEGASANQRTSMQGITAAAGTLTDFIGRRTVRG